MKTTIIKQKMCCKQTQNILKLDKAISFELFKAYELNEKYKKYNAVYIEFKTFTCSGVVGGNLLRINCKSQNCEEELNKFVKELTSL
jgi:hypothetical protein